MLYGADSQLLMRIIMSDVTLRKYQKGNEVPVCRQLRAYTL